MRKFPKEFEEKEVVISRKEFAEITATLLNEVVEGCECEDAQEETQLRALLLSFSALLMAEMFQDLEVE